MVFNVPPGLAEMAVEVVRALGQVRYVERDAFGYALATPNDEKWEYQEDYMDDICARGAWNALTEATKPFTILDSGVWLSDPDIRPNLLTNPSEIEGSLTDNDGNGFAGDYWGSEFLPPGPPFGTFPDPLDQRGHGTSVTSVAGAVGNNDRGIAGMAWSCKILSVKSINALGVGTASSFLQGMEYSHKRGIRLVCCSWTLFNEDSQALRDYITETDDTLYVFGAGNSRFSLDADCGFHMYPQEFPHDNMLVVGGSDGDDLWGFHDFLDPCNPAGNDNTNYGKESVDMFAPAKVYCLRIMNESGTEEGTSFAAPLTVGVAAFLWTLNPAWTPLQVKNRIMITVDVLPNFVDRCKTDGRLNAASAIGVPCTP